jgi:Flp pilus assembly protein TadG
VRVRPSIRREGRRGAAAVEMAVAAILLAPLLIGIWDFGRMIEVQQLLANAAREGGRQASTGNVNTAGVQQVVASYLTRNGIPCSTSNVTVTNLTSSSRNDPTTAQQSDQFQVTVTIPFSSVRLVALNQVAPTSQLTASANWFSMKDVPVTINTTVPLN